MEGSDVLSRRAGDTAHRMAEVLLSAVSHDLRGPLATAKAAVESLRSTDVRFSREQRTELVDTAEESLNRLGRLVENLLDANRLRVGALAAVPQSVRVADAVARSLDELGGAGRDIRVQLPDDLPEVYADAILLERVLVNLLSNALRIFLPFQRLGGRANAAGVGLGLALSRDLVEAMDGTITPDATPGGGLTMTVRLPADR
jgi:two-component system sensor histidine kinase KdpD